MNYELLASFVSLSVLEIILGIDNVIFIALLVATLPKDLSKKARIIGLGLALGMRIVLLVFLTHLMEMTKPLMTIFDRGISGKDMLMFFGGLFLIYKGTAGIHEEITHEDRQDIKQFKGTFIKAIVQIAFIDLIFSLDSIITAVGLTTNVPVIVAAMTIAIIIMIFASAVVADFIKKYPTIKILALSFIMLVGVFLLAEGVGLSVPKGYIYFAMAFSMSIEILNLMIAKKKK